MITEKKKLHQIFELGSGILFWLQKLQIMHNLVVHKEKGIFSIEFIHPVFGKMRFETDFKNKLNEFKGVKFLREKNNISLYDLGGIFDPFTNKVLGEHYSTSHYWGALNYYKNITGTEKSNGNIEKSLNFTLRSCNGYLGSEWRDHYDFNVFCLSNTLEVLSESERIQLLRQIKNAKLNNYKVANWMAMRLFISETLHKYNNSLLHTLRIKLIKQKLIKSYICESGLIEDLPSKSASLQYHVYSSTIFARLFDITGDEQYADIALKGSKYILSLISPNGDFNYNSRGAKQIFGYSAGVFLLAWTLTKTGKDKDWVLKKLINLIDFIKSFQKKDGHLPLVLNYLDEKEKNGWYDYHHLTVYNAFASYWLLQSFRTLKNSGLVD